MSRATSCAGIAYCTQTGCQGLDISRERDVTRMCKFCRPSAAKSLRNFVTFRHSGSVAISSSAEVRVGPRDTSGGHSVQSAGSLSTRRKMLSRKSQNGLWFLVFVDRIWPQISGVLSFHIPLFHEGISTASRLTTSHGTIHLRQATR
jgi:hypothetical protein